MNDPTQRYSLEEKTMNEVLQYLASKPYQEVFQLIGSIQGGLQKVDPISPPKLAEEVLDVVK